MEAGEMSDASEPDCPTLLQVAISTAIDDEEEWRNHTLLSSKEVDDQVNDSSLNSPKHNSLHEEMDRSQTDLPTTPNHLPAGNEMQNCNDQPVPEHEVQNFNDQPVGDNEVQNCNDQPVPEYEVQNFKDQPVGDNEMQNINDQKTHLKEHLKLSNIKNPCNENIFSDLVTGFSSNNSSCVNSPTFVNFNRGSSDFLSAANVGLLVKEYELVKADYQTLQSDYQNSLEREKDLCTRLQEYGGQDDESCNSLTIVNNELRTELEKVLEDLEKSRTENKRLQLLVSKKQPNNNSSVAQAERIEDIVKLEHIISELEKECKVTQEERDNAKEKLAAHDMAAKRAITSLQKDLTLRVDQVTKMHEDVVKEKDVLIVKVAKMDGIIDIHKKKTDTAEKKAAENKKEIERLKSTLKQKDSSLTKLETLANIKDDEINKHKEEIIKQKDEDSSQNMKVKWAQNKLKQELEAHKETKTKLNQAHAKIEETREEGEQIRAACQEMIKKYQNSEEMRSNQLGVKLKERDSAIKMHEHEISVQDEMHRMRTQELEALKTEHRKALNELAQLKTTVTLFEGKISNHTIRNNELEKKMTILVKRDEEANLTDKLLNDTNKELKSYKDQITYFVEVEERLRTQLLDAESEAKDSRQKENELLAFTEKLTENNARWKSQAFDMQSKADDLVNEVAELQHIVSNVDMDKQKQEEKFRKQKEQYESSLEEVVFQLEQKKKLVEELTLNLEEAQDDVKVQKRKNSSIIKDLQRQVLQSKKRLEQLEESLSNSQESLPMNSRTSSNSSLDRLSSDSAPPTASSVPVAVPTGINNQSAHSTTHFTDYSIVQPFRQSRGHSGGEIEVDKAVLVDRICRLQKAHAKKNEKMEFMEEHINSLIEELKKKNRIVQYYVTKEESGTLASNKFDRNKVSTPLPSKVAEMSKRSGIMASVYSSRVSDKDLTLDLSLEINRKLQAVLEDTLLKNMTLKESINTLGSEIARLQNDLKATRR